METRRSFIQKSCLTLAQLPFMHLAFSKSPLIDVPSSQVCIFSKHLHWLDFEELGLFVKELGFDGIDLTVRKSGHIAPEQVEKLLPKAIEAIGKSGISVPMMATDINDADDPLTEKILAAASSCGIKYYRLAWFQYSQDESLESQLRGFRKKIEKLAKLNARYNIHGAYQNHAGSYVGASVWDIWHMVQGLDPRYIGVQFDPRHAVVEGGQSWQTDMRLVKDYIRCSILKDFKWEKKNKWQVTDTPLGDGMVDFSTYFELYKTYNIHGPISLHVEYPMFTEPEDSLSKKQKNELAASVLARELAFVRLKMKTAGL